MNNAKNPSNSVTVAKLLEERAALERRISEARAREYCSVVAEVRQKIKEFGIPLSAVRAAFDTHVAPAARRRAEPKYRDPITGKTWSGRGKPPRWIAGKSRDDFLI